MRGTVLEYDHASESYRIRGDFDGAPRDVPAEDVAPIASDPDVQSVTPDFGMFTAPAPLEGRTEEVRNLARKLGLPE